MFIKYIKELSLKKILKSSLDNVKPSLLNSSIKTVGLLIDESYFQQTEDLIKELVESGVVQSDIKILIFRNKIKKNEQLVHDTFSRKNMNWRGEFKQEFVAEFLKFPFDMLISYYDTEKKPLLLATHQSKALFKVGFSTVDKRLNHLMINTNVENYKVFVHELFRYLKILNKI